ncbi:hypothetical protein Tcan_07181 [Toxocara canis]|uniref:Uncharacterized protein n=1 Tax=Toxocara canis TaxID=6265 RepID=A0A0B2VE16_TOXCA|nr:hypothetical protein Tcan_07181 [Toxocara canis]
MSNSVDFLMLDNINIFGFPSYSSTLNDVTLKNAAVTVTGKHDGSSVGWTVMSQKGEKVRSKEDEEALDRKIAEIRKKNELIARRKEEVDKDRETFATEIGESIHSPKKETEKEVDKDRETFATEIGESIHSPKKETEKTENAMPSHAKSSKANEWDREWDAGKTSADTWKENVPEMGHSLRGGYGGYSSWGSQQRGRGRGRGHGTPRSEFALHDDRAEPKRKSERHLNSTDTSHTKAPVTNVTAQKGKTAEKKQSQGSTRPSDKAHNTDNQKREVQATDRKKSGAQSAQANKDEVKPKREGEKRASKEDGKLKGPAERNERGRGRGGAMGAGRTGKGTGTERVAVTKNDSNTTGSPKRIVEIKRPGKDKLDGFSRSKEASNNGKQHRPNRSTPPIENGSFSLSLSFSLSFPLSLLLHFSLAKFY